MVTTRRLIVATLSGVLFGCVCLGFASSAPGPLAMPVVLQILTERTLIGFAIGISCLALGHWSVHGLVMGLIFSLPLAFSGMMAPDSPQYGKVGMFVATVVMGMLYGLLIELITSVLFKARMQSARSA